MKLLGWMHRKLRQNEPLKVFCIGQAYNCLTSQSSTEDHQETFPHQKLNHVNNKSPYMEFTHEEEEEEEQDHDHYYEDLFHGFLAIGTLGSTDPMGRSTHPSTPTFEFSLENITENEATDEATEDELKLINDELVKVLVEESARNSYASGGGRSSHGSTITLSGKGLVEGRVSNGVCPLQEYLFGSAVEIPAEGEEKLMGEGRKKEARTSLGELFQRSKMDENGGTGKWETGEKKISDQKEAGEKFHVQVMKMMMKKLLDACSKKFDDSSSGGGGGGGDYGSAEKKLHKIMRMFHMKVHPESTEAGQAAAARKAGSKSEKHKEKSNKKKGSSFNNNNNNEARDGMGAAAAAAAGEGTRRGYIRQSNPVAEFTFDDCDSNGSRECWIKTDAQYLVLEL